MFGNFDRHVFFPALVFIGRTLDNQLSLGTEFEPRYTVSSVKHCDNIIFHVNVLFVSSTKKIKNNNG